MALNLAERLALRREGCGPEPAEPQEPEVAARRLREWRACSPFAEDEWWARRLALDGLDERRFLALLGESGESLKQRCGQPPVWLRRLAEAWSEGCVESGKEHRLPRGALSSVIEPLSHQAFVRVLESSRDLTRRHPSLPFEPKKAGTLLFATVVQRLDQLLSQPVALEMRVAQLQGQLVGTTPEERFQRFLAHLEQPERAAAFLYDYPVLARLAVEILELWADSSIELLGRLAADWDMIRSTFFDDTDPGELEDVSGGLGDLHRGGRAVRSLRFTSGSRLVYKPRSLAVESQFKALLEWLQDRGAPDLRMPKVVDRGGYGWMEFVTPRPCTSRSELAGFYRRQGALLGVLHALAARDLHRENLIAVGEHPILVDLELLCEADYGRCRPEAYDSVAEYEWDNSVMGVMLLPFFHEGVGRKIMDPSGLGGEGGQMSVHAQPRWVDWGTDRMRLVYEEQEMPGVENRPTLNGEAVNPFDFGQQIEEGFEAIYRLLVGRRSRLLAAASPLQRLHDVEVRSVLRASAFYAFILRQSYHPDFLRDALERDRHFDRMWYGMDRSKFSAVSMQLLPTEREDLWRGDIPYFSTRVASRDLWTSGGACLPSFFIRSALEVVRSRLGKLGEEDLSEQLWYVRGSLTALAMRSGGGIGRYTLSHEPQEVGSGRLLQAAVAAGERIQTLAKRGQGQASWVGLAWTNTHGWWLRPLEYDLHSGLPGIILFLGYLGEVTAREDFAGLAEEALATLHRQLQRRPRWVRFLGGFDGWGGLVLTWVHLASLWERDDLLAEALEKLPRISALIDSDEELDLIRGSAGGIVPLLALHRATGSQEALALARRMGDRLVAAARPFEAGKAWLVAASPRRPLTGFSHGAAGPAWALAELYAATGDERYREVALEAVAFEDSVFSAKHANWPDLRSNPGEEGTQEPGFMAAWCHGACGIGLSRLRMLRSIGGRRIRADAEIAAETTARRGFGSNHSLCHGDLGSLELLLEASRFLDNGRWAQEGSRLAARVLASIDEHGFLSGVPRAVETPGLMDGIAGIGYGLLRFAEPESVPSLLLLDPPVG